MSSGKKRTLPPILWWGSFPDFLSRLRVGIDTPMSLASPLMSIGSDGICRFVLIETSGYLPPVKQGENSGRSHECVPANCRTTSCNQPLGMRRPLPYRKDLSQSLRCYFQLSALSAELFANLEYSDHVRYLPPVRNYYRFVGNNSFFEICILSLIQPLCNE